MALETLYTIEETAKFLKVHPSTLFSRMRDGKIERIHCDGRTLIAESAIKKYLKEHTLRSLGSELLQKAS